MTPNIQEPIDEPPFRPGKDEMNFAEFPIALLTDRVPKGQKNIKFEDQIYDEKRKRLVTRRRIIEGSEEYGLPTATDDAVILALIQITKRQNNLTQREVEFTRLDLIKMLGWADEGRSYDRIKLSLLRIANVTYNFDNAWWDARQKTWTTKAFHIIDVVEINDSRASGGQGGIVSSRIVWGDVVFDSFQAGFLRNIDFELCMRLEHPTALRMYRFLGKRFYVKPEWTFGLKEFAYDHIGISRNYEGGTQIARKLQPAIAELEGVGFLERLREDERFTKRGRDWSVRFVRKPPALDLATPSRPAAAKSPSSPLVAELVRRGVATTRAEELSTGFDAERIAGKLEVFDWMTARQDKRIAQNPAGYLVQSITDDYAAPKGFVSQAEHARREHARQAEQRQAAEEQRRRQDQGARERAERLAIAAYWNALTPEQQAAHDAEAVARADAEELKLIVPGPIGRLGLSWIRDQYLTRLLRDQGTLPSAEA
jgi:hypothetical protein